MTDDQVNAAIHALIGASDDHDAEVDETVGLATCKKCGDTSFDFPGLGPECRPNYTADLNLAVRAGQQAGLFDYDVGIHPRTRWTYIHHYFFDGSFHCECNEQLAYHESPARAVCEAILKFIALKAAKKIVGDGDHRWL